MRVRLVGQDFDAVRVPGNLGPDLAAILTAEGGRGPVLADPYSGVWHFLTHPGTMSNGPWAGCGIRLMRPSTRLTVPAADVLHGQDLHWHVAPGNGHTTAKQLTANLLKAAGLPMTSSEETR
ncbi:hypothetical protein ACFYNX_26975 [Streptomyces sp. NPDC007872]|uniref:hypothetical protein n=1 Tax=Streptomyces sp. NPDC007872 TaxID=3364782 RepID=UPI00369C5016